MTIEDFLKFVIGSSLNVKQSKEGLIKNNNHDKAIIEFILVPYNSGESRCTELREDFSEA